MRLSVQPAPFNLLRRVALVMYDLVAWASLLFGYKIDTSYSPAESLLLGLLMDDAGDDPPPYSPDPATAGPGSPALQRRRPSAGHLRLAAQSPRAGAAEPSWASALAAPAATLNPTATSVP